MVYTALYVTLVLGMKNEKNNYRIGACIYCKLIFTNGDVQWIYIIM